MRRGRRKAVLLEHRPHFGGGMTLIARELDLLVPELGELSERAREVFGGQASHRVQLHADSLKLRRAAGEQLANQSRRMRGDCRHPEARKEGSSVLAHSGLSR